MYKTRFEIHIQKRNVQLTNKRNINVCVFYVAKFRIPIEIIYK